MSPRTLKRLANEMPEPEIDAWLVREAEKAIRGRRLSNDEVKALLGF